jgi:hypothetical protein
MEHCTRSVQLKVLTFDAGAHRIRVGMLHNIAADTLDSRFENCTKAVLATGSPTFQGSCVIFVNIAKLEATRTVLLRLVIRFAELFLGLGIRRQVTASLTVDCRKAVFDEFDIDASEGVILRRRLCGIDQAKVENIALLMVDVRDEFPAFAKLAETVDCLGVVLAFRRKELHEAKASQ